MMTDEEIIELAAILVNEHGHGALRVANYRRDHFAYEPHSDAFRLWSRIAEATARQLGVVQRQRVEEDCS